jgi:phosphoribosylamine--glycine ligase
VLGVTAVAPTLAEARAKAYAAAAPIEWDGLQMRHDIAARAAGDIAARAAGAALVGREGAS